MDSQLQNVDDAIKATQIHLMKLWAVRKKVIERESTQMMAENNCNDQEMAYYAAVQVATDSMGYAAAAYQVWQECLNG